MRGELMWIRWVSGRTLLQGTSVMMSAFIFNGTLAAVGGARCVIKPDSIEPLPPELYASGFLQTRTPYTNSKT
eukprot:1077602-Pelagomonas_calceolata.AAC.1